MIVPISNSTNLLVKRKKKEQIERGEKRVVANVPKKNCSADAKWRRNRNQIADEFLDDVVFFLPRFFFAVFPSFFLRSATLSLATRWSLGFGFFLFAINFRDAIFLRGVSFSFWRFFWGFFFCWLCGRPRFPISVSLGDGDLFFADVSPTPSSSSEGEPFHWFSWFLSLSSSIGLAVM